MTGGPSASSHLPHPSVWAVHDQRLAETPMMMMMMMMMLLLLLSVPAKKERTRLRECDRRQLPLVAEGSGWDRGLDWNQPCRRLAQK